MKINSKKTAVIGCGKISDIYLDNLKHKFEIIDLVVCSDISEERMEAQAEKFSIEARTYESILADSSIEIIVNLTNPSAHYELCKKALMVGKNVYTEKNLATTYQEAQELVALAKEKNVLFGCAPDTFLGGGLQTARYILEKKLIGEVTSVTISLNRDYHIFGDLFPYMYQAGGSMSYDYACYYLMAAISLLGSVEKISAFGKIEEPSRRHLRPDRPWFDEAVEISEDNVQVAILQFESNILGTIHINAQTINEELPQIQVFGTEGILQIGNPNEFDTSCRLIKYGGTIEDFPLTHGYSENSRGVAVADLAWAIERRRPYRSDASLGLHVLEIIEGIGRSSSQEKVYQMATSIEKPWPLSAGYLDKGFWGPSEETALSLGKN